MGVSSYFEVVPEQVLERLKRDEEVIGVFAQMWGASAGMHSWFEELDEEEIEEITGELSPSAVKELRTILSDAQNMPSAYIENTHELHTKGLARAFAMIGAPNPAELGRLVISGEKVWTQGDFLNLVSHERCRTMAQYMQKLVIADVIDSYDLGECEGMTEWREELAKELRKVINCYLFAADHGHQVLLGCI